MQQRKPTDVRRPSRREVIWLGVGAFAAAVAPFSLLRKRRILVRRSVPVMGTFAELAVVHDDELYAHRAIDAAITELRWVERVMTRFTTTSDVGRANASAAHEPVAITDATAAVLRESLQWAEASDGVFDPCLGRAVELWDVANRREPPPEHSVRALAGRKPYRALELDTWRGKAVVGFDAPDVAIDLGGIAKGFGVDRSVQALREWGITQALVNVGGDLYALGQSVDGDPWNIGIRSPQDPSQISGTIEITDQAVATSGDYLQFFTHRGKRYHHLLDSSTGGPREAKLHSVTVVADRCMTADAAATTAFGMERVDAERVVRSTAAKARIV